MLVWLPASLHIFAGSKIICKPLVTNRKMTFQEETMLAAFCFFWYLGIFFLFIFCLMAYKRGSTTSLCVLQWCYNKNQGMLFLARIKLFLYIWQGDEIDFWFTVVIDNEGKRKNYVPLWICLQLKHKGRQYKTVQLSGNWTGYVIIELMQKCSTSHGCFNNYWVIVPKAIIYWVANQNT